MAQITAGMVKELREKTGAGMMDAKKALTETDGDMEKAVVYLREKGLAASAKKAARIAAEGVVAISISEDNKTASLVEVNCETDFVGKNEEFRSFAENVADVLKTKKIEDMDSLLDLNLEGATVRDQQSSLVAKIGEKIEIRRFKTLENDYVHGYLHKINYKVATLVSLKAENPAVYETEAFQNLAKDLAMQVAAASPRYLDRTQVDSTEIEKEKEITANQLRNEGKKEEMIERIVSGKLNSWYAEICLLDQSFIKEDKKSVTAIIKEVEKTLNTKITVSDFVRFEVGEGIEKRQDNFADEVAAQLQN
ncbi:elongation factor Ts [bacterium]|nr:elongation factor Ts [bacterium]